MLAALPYLIAGTVGALIAGRNAPRARIQKLKAFGPKSGFVYDVDLVPHLGVVIIHGPSGSSGVFQQNVPPKPGFMFVRGVGTPEAIDIMKKDIES
jgi:hypothetical protein